MRAQVARHTSACLPTASRSRAAVRKIDTRDFRRATRSTPRQINRQILLNLVREHQPISRADLARRMTLGRGVVTTLVNELLEEGVLYEGALGELPRGRRPKMLHVETRDRLVVAIDLRFSRTDVLLADLGGKQIALERFATRFGPEELLDEPAVRVARGGGTGVVVHGEVVRGYAHTAGEFGHIPISAEGPICLCGSQGCLEGYTSNLATVARYLGHELSPAIARELLQQSGVTVDDVVRRAGEGDERARAAVADTGRYLGIGVS